MKVRIVYTILLLVFSFCSLTSIAQLPATEEAARTEWIKVDKKYQDAKTDTRDAYVNYNEADKVRSFLETVKNDIELENRDNWEDLKEGAVELIADLGQVAATRGREVPISSMAASAINGVSDIADWNDLQGQLSDINSAITAENANTAMLYSAWQSALQTEEDLKERADYLYVHWLSFTKCAGCNKPGVEHNLHASCWNAKYGCPETNVWSCTHNCDYDPVSCLGCRQMMAPEKHRSNFEKALHKQIICGDCNTPYYLCNYSDVESHRPRICYSGIWSLDSQGNYILTGHCGNSYRNCTKYKIVCNAMDLKNRCTDLGSFTGLCPSYSGPSHTCVLCE